MTQSVMTQRINFSLQGFARKGEETIGKEALLCAQALFKLCAGFVGQDKLEKWQQQSGDRASDLGSSREAKEKLEADRKKRAKSQQVMV